jgi:broad specificity phosphatase PhoE
MTLRLDLLRHGETELGGGLRGSLDDALTDKGWQQMRAAVVEQGPWDRLVSSPLQRCARFAMNSVRNWACRSTGQRPARAAFRRMGRAERRP